MSNQFLKLRRSAVPGKIPTTSSLEFGEIALNTYDGLAFMKKSGSAGEEIVTIGSTSGSFTGSLFGTASWAINAITASYFSGSIINAIFAETASYVANINGEEYKVAIFGQNNSITSSTIYQSASFTAIRATAPNDPTNPDLLFVDGTGIESYNLVSAITDIDSYAQLNIKNVNAGSTSSADIVATNNIGDEESYYINMGINGDGYNVVDGIGAQNDAYLYSTGEDLLIGNAAEGKRVIIFNGTGSALNVARVFIVPEGTVGINSLDPNPSNPESLLVEPIAGATDPSTFSNLIIGKGTIHESYLQSNIINLGTGSAASADVVATNDIGTETDYFIDMGINSSGYNTPNAIGMANDAYLYSTGEHLHIGNASADMPVMFFAGGFDSEANRKLELWPDNQHQMTGSLNASEGFTGSLYGTASWALNALTASSATTASWAVNALTASSADNFVVRGDLTGSNAVFTGTITAQRLNVQYITSSTDFVTGSTKFGTQLTDTHQFTGSVSVTGSLSVNGGIVPLGSGTAGQVTVWSTANQLSGSNNLFWDTTNGRLGVGISSPNSLLHVSGGSIQVESSAALTAAAIRANGLFGFNTISQISQRANFYGFYTQNQNASIGIGGNAQTNTAIQAFNYLTWAATPLSLQYYGGDVIIGPYSGGAGSGDRLQVSGSTLLKGDGNTSATNALTVQNSDSLNSFRIDNSGQLLIGTRPVTIFPTADGSTASINGRGLVFSFNIGGNAYSIHKINAPGLIATAGTVSTLDLTSVFAPTSGNAIHNSIWSQPTINQTGGANGVTRGLYVNPTLTAAADWRSIEWSNNTGWGLYGAGTVKNYLNGNLLLGTTTDAGFKLDVNGTARIVGDTQIGNTSNNGTDNVGVLTVRGSTDVSITPANHGTYARLNLVSSNQSGGTFTNHTAIFEQAFNGILNISNTALSGDINLITNIAGVQTNALQVKGGTNNILIGTTTDSGFKLDVSGSARITNGLIVTGSSTINNLTGSLFGTASWALNAVTASFVPSSGVVGDFSRIATGSVTASVGVGTGSFQLVSGSSTLISVNNTGSINIGISGSSPSILFPTTVGGFGMSLQSSYSGNSIEIGRNNGASFVKVDGSNSISLYGNTTVTGINGTTAFTVNQGNLAWPTIADFQAVGTSRMRILTNGNVGIGTTTPSASLHISGSTGILFEVDSNTQNNILYVTSSGQVGIGYATTGSLYRLDISGSARVTDQLYVDSASIDYQQNLSLQTGSWQTIVAAATGSYRAAFFDYAMFSGSIGRAGTVTTFWSASATEFYENYTEDLGGSTAGVVLQTAISASQIVLQATASSAAWTIRSLVRLL